MIGQSGGLEPTRDSNPVGLEEHLRSTSAPHHTINNVAILYQDGEKYSCVALAKSGLAHQHARQTNQFKSRVEICRDCHDRRLCKIFANCVNFPGKQRDFMHNMRRSTRFVICTETVEIVHAQ